MADNKKTDDDGWKWLLLSVLIPVALGIAWAVVAFLLVGCEVRYDKWIGVDRARVSCSLDDNTRRQSSTCIGDGRIYKCVTDRDYVWRCAELVQPQIPRAEAGGGQP